MGYTVYMERKVSNLICKKNVIGLTFRHSKFFFSSFLAVAETIVTSAHSLCTSINVAVTYCIYKCWIEIKHPLPLFLL